MARSAKSMLLALAEPTSNDVMCESIWTTRQPRVVVVLSRIPTGRKKFGSQLAFFGAPSGKLLCLPIE